MRDVLTNKELGRLIYVALFSEPEDELDFEIWYEQCWNECMNDAVNAIGVGCGSYEDGTSIELSWTVTKSGRTEVFFFEKENFDEYYGERDCFRMFHTQKQVEYDLIAYFSGGAISEYYSDEQEELFAEACREWEALPCDPEGANDEQNEALDELLEEYAEKIWEAMN